jgi:hypothetical protein
VGARAQAPLDVVDRLLGTDIAGGHIGDGVTARQGGIDIGRCRDAGRIAQPRERRRILAVLVR